MPERVVGAFAAETGGRVPGRGAARGARRTALGALAGIANGLGVGELASAVRSYGVPLPAPVGAVVIGAAAMAATDVPVALLWAGDPRTRTAADWLAGAASHLASGGGADRARGGADPALAGPVLTAPTSAVVRDPGTTRRRVLAGKAMAAAGLVGELVADKHPDAPDRDSAGSLAGRILYGAEGGARLAARERANGALPAFAGVAGAWAGAWAGHGWRRWSAGRMPALQAALVEDAVALGLAALACLPGRHRSHLVVVPGSR